MLNKQKSKRFEWPQRWDAVSIAAFLMKNNGIRISKVEIITKKATTTKSNYCTTITVTTPAVTSAGWATYVAAYDMEFTDGEAFVVTSVGEQVNLTSVTQVAAGTPLLLKGAGAKTATVLNETPAAVTNKLAVSDGTNGVNDYVLAKPENKSVGFYKWTGSALAAGKVYLPASEVNAREFIGFDEASSIDALLKNEKKNMEYYDLQGRRVTQPSKGLYIVNGKKVIKK